MRRFISYISGLCLLLSFVYGLGEPPAVARAEIIDQVSGNVRIMTIFKVNDEVVAREVIESGEPKFIGEIPDGRVDFYNKEGELIGAYTFKEGALNGRFKHYYKNKNTSEEGNYEQNRITGKRRAYFQNGKLAKEASYDKDRLHGVFKTFDNEGRLDLEVNYFKDELNGPYKIYYNNGKLKEQGYFYQNELNQDRITYLNNGQIEKKGSYVDGLLNGSFRQYNNDGSIFLEFNYKDNKLHGECNTYVKGNLFRKQFFEEGTRVRFIEYTYHASGQPKSIANFGVIRGDYLQSGSFAEGFTEDPSPQYPSHFFRDFEQHPRIIRLLNEPKITGAFEDVFDYYQETELFHGRFVSFYDNENNSEEEEGRYDNNMKTGLWKKYYPDKIVSSEENYLYGQLNGKSKYYDKQGSLAVEGNWVNDLQEGTWKTYWENGEVAYRDVYTEGQLAERKSYDVDGVLFEKGFYQNNSKHGQWTTYWKTGKVAYKDLFDYGAKVMREAFDQTGHLVEKGSFSNDKRHGVWKIYWESSAVVKYYDVYRDGEQESRRAYDTFGNQIWSKEY